MATSLRRHGSAMATSLVISLRLVERWRPHASLQGLSQGHVAAPHLVQEKTNRWPNQKQHRSAGGEISKW
ncbi:hypothetical protein ACLOJK_030048 [Asimina triloba]